MNPVRILPRLAALVLFLVLSCGAAAADRYPPRRIAVDAPVHAVYCLGPCCCGSVEATYRGHYYDAGAKGYCRWFRPLRDGQVVRATLTLVW